MNASLETEPAVRLAEDAALLEAARANVQRDAARLSGASVRPAMLKWWPRRVAAAEPLAAALMDHHLSGRPRRVRASRADGVVFEIETEEYFTLEGQLGELDRQAMDHCRGRVLDVGAGAGRHALELEGRGLEVVAIDISPICTRLCAMRGVRDARTFDVMSLCEAQTLGRFDTIFFGMQTLGVAGGFETLIRLLGRLRPCLAPGGQILADSSVLREAWQEDAATRTEGDGLRAAGPEAGEIVLRTRYRGWFGASFPWLYLGAQHLAEAAARAGFGFEMLGSVESGEYLASLRPESESA